MQILNNAVMYVLSFQPYVLLPVIIFILALIFRIKIAVAIKSSFSIGIGFIGIFIVFDYFVKIVNPVVTALVQRIGLHFNVLDTGWPPLSAISWSFELAPILVIIFIAINILMLVLKLTKTVDIDIWNYWHVILASVMVYHVTNSVLLSILSAAIAFIMVLKLAEWSAPLVNEISGMQGICIPHLSAIAYFPPSVIINNLFDHVPFINKIDLKTDNIQNKLGLFGEPMILGFIIGLLLGIAGGYTIKDIAELSIGFAAVIFILPIMCGFLGTALIPISEGMKDFINQNFPNLHQTFIGLDVAILFGLPSVIITTLLLIPVSLILAFILPGINFIPLGDLTNLMVPVAMICVATKGNVFRSFIIGIPVVIGNLYIASAFANLFTDMAASSNYKIPDYNGLFTSFLDGGNFFRAWILKAFSGDVLGLALIPVVLGLMFTTWILTKPTKQIDEKQ